MRTFKSFCSIDRYGVMIAFTVLLLPLLHTGRTLIRAEGALLLLLYAGYMTLLWPG